MTIEQLTEEAFSLPSEARAALAGRLVENLDPVEDDAFRHLWAAKARGSAQRECEDFAGR